MNKNQNYTLQPQVVDPTPIFDQSNQALSQYIEREGIIVIKPINPNAHRNETLSFGGFKGFGYWDQGRTQKFWFGTILGNNPDGTKKYKKINIVDGRMYYLANPEDAWEWHIVRHHFSVQGSPNQFGKPRWIVEDEKRDSKKSIDKGQKFVTVFEFINKMTDSRIRSFGRIFGMDANNNTPDIIKGQLIARAMEKPDVFMPYINDQEMTDVNEMFHRAIAMNVITFRLDRGYLFNDSVPLGINEQMAIGNLMANKDLLVTIDMISRERDNTIPEDEKKAPVLKSSSKPAQKPKTETVPNKDDF